MTDKMSDIKPPVVTRYFFYYQAAMTSLSTNFRIIIYLIINIERTEELIEMRTKKFNSDSIEDIMALIWVSLTDQLLKYSRIYCNTTLRKFNSIQIF